MEIGTIIGSSIAGLIMGVFSLVYFRTKDRKEPLAILRVDDTIHLLLTQDEYCDFDISDIKDDKEKINEEIKKVVKARASELVKFVDKVSYLDGTDEKLEKELLEIIQSAKK